MQKGLFITIEGPDGAGKTTQLHKLAEWLTKQGRQVICTREPGGTAIGDKIRVLLLDNGNAEMAPRTEALLYMAARSQHVAELIRPALADGKVVLSDRYSDSTLVYQGVARQLSSKELIQVNQFATAGLKPDLTILLDGETTPLLERLHSRGAKDRMESETIEFHEKVRDGFLELAASEPERFRVVNGSGDIDTVQAAIRCCVLEFNSGR